MIKRILLVWAVVCALVLLLVQTVEALVLWG